MFARHLRLAASGAVVCLLSFLSAPAGAQIIVGGDPGEVFPADPNTWTTDTNSEVGMNSGLSGSITVAGGSKVTDNDGCLAGRPGSAGTATVTGVGSQWNNTGYLYVGYLGRGVLNICGGGQVTSDTSYVAYFAGSTGAVTVTGAGSQWTNSSVLSVGYPNSSGRLTVTDGGLVTTSDLYASLSDLCGNGVITLTDGAILDADLILDATHAFTRTIPFGNGGTINLPISLGTFGVGFRGIGTLRITDGQTLACGYGGLLGCLPGSSGTATVSGVGSQWINDGSIYVGNTGNGTLNIRAGGLVSSSDGKIGWDNRSIGTVTVSGTGSQWINSGFLKIGFAGEGTGTLTIGSGGKVTASYLRMTQRGLAPPTLNLHISGDGMLVLGNSTTAGSISNEGKINLYADAFLAARTYSPITESQNRQFTGFYNRSYSAYGGMWNTDAHTFTPSPVTTSASAASNTLTTGERLLITDSGTGKRVGASFGTVAAGTSFSAAVLGGADLIGLPADQSVLGAWNFSTNFAGDQALLSFDIGAGQAGELSVWHYDGTTWKPFAAPDLTYGDDGIANFAVTGFGGYAVTVPEPCSLALLVMGGWALLRRRRR